MCGQRGSSATPLRRVVARPALLICENMCWMEEFLNSARWSLRTKEERDRQSRKRGHPWGVDVFNPILAQLSLFPVNCWRKWKLGVQFLVIHHFCQSTIKYHVIRAECRNMLWILEFERKINVNKRVCLLWRPGTRKDQNCFQFGHCQKVGGLPLPKFFAPFFY